MASSITSGTDALRFAVGTSTLGTILVATSDNGIRAILFGGEPATLVRDLQERFPEADLIADDAAPVDAVARFIETPTDGLDLPLDLCGTNFQRRVWDALRAIPAGTTVSYAEIAARIGAPRAVRAVARACAANPIAIAVPCHRVVRSDGAMGGYRGGPAAKQTLLELEAAA